MGNQWVVPAPPAPAVAVAGSDGLFPVHRIYCVGRNYREHVREMGGDPAREPPIFFSKPADAVHPSGEEVPYPGRTANLHHEIELVVAIGGSGRDVGVPEAIDLIYGYAVGNDLTRRDLQAEARKKGAPWDTAKGFDASAPITPIRRASEIGHPRHGRIWLEVNGVIRQDADIGEMTWSVAEILAELSAYYALRPGDLIFTGTPAGVGALAPGDLVRGGIDDVGVLQHGIAAA